MVTPPLPFIWTTILGSLTSVPTAFRRRGSAAVPLCAVSATSIEQSIHFARRHWPAYHTAAPNRPYALAPGLAPEKNA
jgi:hypothetical protein